MSSALSVGESEEARFLTTLRSSISLISEALNSLGGTTTKDVKARYIFWTASFINHTSVGFLNLKEMNLRSAKLLVRPCLEATFNVQAAVSNQSFLFEKACDEWREENKYFPKDSYGIQQSEAALDHLKTEFGSHASIDEIKKRRLGVHQAAQYAGMTSLYNTAYRIYCQYTHGAIRAAVGDLDEITDSRDTAYVTFGVLTLVRLLRDECGASVMGLEQLEAELVSINIS